MDRHKRALIICAEVAVNGFESGASLRLNTINDLIVNSGFQVSIVPRSSAVFALKSEWDLVVLTSYVTAKFLRRARMKTENLWFDPVDSWRLGRMSLFYSGDLKQILVLARDLFWLTISPKIDLLTFISKRDMDFEKNWWRNRVHPFVLPIFFLEREVLTSTEARLVFIGNGTYKPNRDAIDFLKEMLNHLPRDFVVHLYGHELNDSSVRFVNHGYVPDGQLFYSSDIYLVPIMSGAGIKLKTAIPLRNGLQVIATPEGGNGFIGMANLFICQNPKEFADQVQALNMTDRNGALLNPRDEIYSHNQMAFVVDWLMQKI
jgi:hypothetical protein